MSLLPAVRGAPGHFPTPIRVPGPVRAGWDSTATQAVVAALPLQPELMKIPGMPRPALAYFITLRTYGTWLAGDARGSVDKAHNLRGEPFLQRDDFRRAYQQRRMRSPAITLDGRSRAVVAAAILDVCTHRGWDLLALNVRTNHAHIVVEASSNSAERVMGDFKAYATRAMRASGLLAAGQPTWAGHGSTVHCFTEAEVAGVIEYTNHGQGDDLPGGTLPGLDASE
jgi:REP element-mobilizing transposase RayT